jgi:hypothetical protein
LHIQQAGYGMQVFNKLHHSCILTACLAGGPMWRLSCIMNLILHLPQYRGKKSQILCHQAAKIDQNFCSHSLSASVCRRLCALTVNTCRVPVILLTSFRAKFFRTIFEIHHMSRSFIFCLTICFYSWFQTFAVFCMLYVFFWVIPRRLKFLCRRFGTLCLFHLHRQVGVEWLPDYTYLPMKMEQTEYFETSAYKI